MYFNRFNIWQDLKNFEQINEMIDVGDCVRSHERHDENMEMSKDKRPESGLGKRRTRTGVFAEPETKIKGGRLSSQALSTENETYRIFQALLLTFTVLVLSYHGLRYGRFEYSILENGQIVSGFVSARRAVITFSLGYSVYYSFLSSLTACMLLYSLISKRPGWSLPMIFLYMADFVCQVADALVAFWLFFGHLKLSTALLYSAGTASIIAGELWVWLGVLRLWEYRTSK